ncbi:MAG: B12-binding domain-containing radical SAM protein [Chloroflexi bacterium]|nr:B12-binding domain-containing radical SAM protein [Chloroflexota bacterium]
MRVILISPFPDAQAFGLRTLSACLKREKHEVQILFLPREFTAPYESSTLDEVAEMSRGAELIGISVMTNFFDNVVQLTRRLKRLGIPIIWGGIHPTIRPLECLDHADMICVGEGEEAIVELARKMADGQDYSTVEGIWLKFGDTAVRNERRSLVQDLDSLPFPDYDYQTHYMLDGKAIRQMDDDLFVKYTNGVYMTIPSRGCPFGCTYCSNNTLNSLHPGQKLPRQRSIDNVIAELAEVVSTLPVKCIKFDDDAFFLYSLEATRDFCEKYKEKVGLPLIVTGATPSTVTREKLSLLADAGLIFVRMGIQSASERVNRLYRRRHTNRQVEEAAKVLNEFRDKIGAPQYDLILDNPWETDDDLVETLMFLTTIPTPCLLFPFSLTLYPETELYRKAKEEGLIRDDLLDVYRKDYHLAKKTYLNRLFYLLNEHTKVGKKLSPRVMSWLTNRQLRRLRLSWLAYALVKVDLFAKTGRLKPTLPKPLRAVWRVTIARARRASLV